MGLLDLFRKKDRNEQVRLVEAEEGMDEITLYSGMRVEVAATSGQILFMAELTNLQEDMAQLEQYSIDSIADHDKITEPIPVRIRGYNDRDRKAIYMEGMITPQPKHMWQVEDLEVLRSGNDRTFFRLDTNIAGSAITFGGADAGERPCRLLNISIGGACIRSEHAYRMGDKFLLRVKLMEDRETSIIFCQVVRITEQDSGKFEYGCRFLELNEVDQDRITENIMESQRQKQ